MTTKPKKPKREMTGVHLPPKLKDELRKEASGEGRSLSSHIYCILRDRKETK